MVIKINQPSTPFTSSEWYEYFFKRTKKNTKQMCILRECFKNIELNLPFLDVFQHWGRVYQLLGIPHICGKVNKSKLKEMYIKERKNKYNRLNKLNVDIIKNKNKENKDYRAIIRRNRIINKSNVDDDQIKTELENKKNNLTNKNNDEVNSNTDGNTFDSEISKKKVRFNNVQILRYNKSISSDSDSEYVPTLSQKIITNKSEIHKPYFEKLNDSQSCESLSDNEGNDNDTGIISPISSGEEVNINSQVEDHSNSCMEQGKSNDITQDDILSESISETSDQPLNESNETLSDLVENDYDTGLMSPLSCSMENINESFSDNVSNSEDNISNRSSDLPSEEEEILCSPGEGTEYNSREIKIARENAKRKPKVLTDFNNGESINNQRDNISAEPVIYSLSAGIKENMSRIVHATSSEEEPYSYNTLCTALTGLNIESIQETQKTDEISSMSQITKEHIENEKSLKLLNRLNFQMSNTSNEKSSLDIESDELSSDFNEQNLADSSHLNAEELVIFIPSGNLVCPKIDHLEDYRLSSSSSIGSIRTSLLQKDLGFGNISKPKIICDEELEDKNSKNDSLVRDSPCDRSEIDTNSKEPLKTKRNSPKVSSDSKKENQRNDLDENIIITSEDDSPKIIPNSGSYSSEIKEKNHNKRQPLQLLNNNSLLNRFSNKKLSLRNDKENEIQTVTKQVSPLKNQIFLNEKVNIPNQPLSQGTDEPNSFEILPPSYNITKDAYELQEKIRSLYKSKENNQNQNSFHILKENKECKILHPVINENLRLNSNEYLFSNDKEMIATDKEDENMTDVTIHDDVKNKDSSINSNGSLATDTVMNTNNKKQSVTNKIVKHCSGNNIETNKGNDNFLQLRARSSKANIFQAVNNKINEPESLKLFTNIRSLSHTDSIEENKLSANDNEALNQFRRKTTVTKMKAIFSDYEENYADSSSNASNESIELHKKVKRRKKKSTGIARMKNISYNNDKSPEVTSDDMELIQNIQNDNKRAIYQTLSIKKTTTTDKIVISQNVGDITTDHSKDNNTEFDSTGGGGQRINQELEMKRKTSAVKQQISNASQDTSTTNEFVSYALARRIYYLNQS